MVNTICDCDAMPFSFSAFAGFTVNSSALNLLVPHRRGRRVRVECYSYVPTSLEHTIRFLDQATNLLRARLLNQQFAQLAVSEPEPEGGDVQPANLLAQLEKHLMEIIEERVEAKLSQHPHTPT